MFGKQSGQEGKQGTASYNSILAGTEIQGNLQSTSDLRIDGVVQGDVSCQARLVVGAMGKIRGQVSAIQARLEGHIEGNVTISELLELKQTARVQGDIRTQKLIIEDGAVFDGQCKMSS